MMTDWVGSGQSDTLVDVELASAQEKLALWQTALDEIATQGQSYVIKSTTLTRADLDKCFKMVKYYQSEVSRLTAGRSRGMRVMRVIPRDY